MQITIRKPLPFSAQVWDLFLIELTNWRWSWRSMLVTGTIAPVLSIVALGTLGRTMGSEVLGYILSGNLVLSLMFGNMGNIQGHVVFMRFQGAMDYFATLPVRRFALVLAMVMAFLLLSMPSILVTMLMGAFFLGLPLHPSPWLILIVPLCALPLSGIGALIGAGARTPQESDSLNLVITLVLTALGPVIVPPDRLPAFLVSIGRFSPAVYGASAFRQALLGPVTPQLAIDIIALLVFTVIIFYLVSRFLTWRQA